MQSFKKFISETFYHKNFNYGSWKALPGQRLFFDFQVEEKFLEMRNNFPDAPLWLAMTLGSSFHDPQLQVKVINGNDIPVPENVAPIRNTNELQKVWKAMKDIEMKAFKYSRRSY